MIVAPRALIQTSTRAEIYFTKMKQCGINVASIIATTGFINGSK